MKKKTVSPTSARGIAALLKSGQKKQYSAGDGLYLSVNGVNRGSWVFRYKIAGKTRRMGLGMAGDGGLTLANARREVFELKEMLAQGKDPLAERQAQQVEKQKKVVTFDDTARDYIEAKRGEWSNAKHAQQWQNTIATYVSPVIGHLPHSEITTEHILTILRPIWTTKAETARRVRNRIEIILNVAKALKLREGENVAAWRGHLELLLPAQKAQVRHMPALPYEQAPLLWQALKKSQAMAAAPLMLALLTGLRSGEVRFAKWSEFDLQAKLWTVPAERMKTGVEHRVPLSSAAMELLATIPKMPSNLLFEGQKEGQPLSDMTMVMFLRRLDAENIKEGGEGWRDNNGEVIVPHGFRSTLRDWMAEETATPNHVAEQVLAHSISDAVEAAYRRGDLLQKRREVMESWGAYLLSSEACP